MVTAVTVTVLGFSAEIFTMVLLNDYRPILADSLQGRRVNK